MVFQKQRGKLEDWPIGERGGGGDIGGTGASGGGVVSVLACASSMCMEWRVSLTRSHSEFGRVVSGNTPCLPALHEAMACFKWSTAACSAAASAGVTGGGAVGGQPLWEAGESDIVAGESDIVAGCVTLYTL